MTSLKFINKEMIRISNMIYTTKSIIAVRTENKKDTIEFQLGLEVLKEHLNSLQQIKTELEAWEVVKSNFKIGVAEETDEIYIIGKNFFGDERPVYAYSPKGVKTVKKALEVKDEKED